MSIKGYTETGIDYARRRTAFTRYSLNILLGVILAYGLSWAESGNNGQNGQEQQPSNPAVSPYVGRCVLHNLKITGGRMHMDIQTGPDVHSVDSAGTSANAGDYTAKSVTVSHLGANVTVATQELPKGGQPGANTAADVDITGLGVDLTPGSSDMVGVTAQSPAGNLLCGPLIVNGVEGQPGTGTAQLVDG